MAYHRRYRSFHRATLDATRLLLQGWGRHDDERRWRRSRIWLRTVSSAYGMRTPKLVIDPHASSGFYRLPTNTIHMAYPSVVTLLHEFRHAMQRQAARPNSPQIVDVEDDARAWSLSLYYKVAPRTFRRLAAEGRILHLSAEEMRLLGVDTGQILPYTHVVGREAQ